MDRPESLSSQTALTETVKKHFEFFVQSSERAATQSVIDRIRAKISDSDIEVIFNEMRETGVAAGISPGSQKHWIAANFGHKSSLAREYAQYAGKIGKEKNVDALIDETIAKAGIFKVCGFLTRSMQTAPLFGIVTASIFEDAKNPESELSKKLNGENRPIDRWYPEVIHESANAFYGIETIFQELGERCKSEDQKRQLKPFLEAWKKQLQMYVLDCVNLLNGYVMHLKKEDCAVIYSTTDFQVHMEKFGQIQKRLLQLQAHKVYSKKTEKDHVNYCGLFSNLAKFNPDFSRQGRTNVSVPTMISAMDVCRLVYFLSEFFENIRNGLQANKKLYVNSCVGDTAKYLPLMSRSRQKLATIQLRPEEDDNGQARINLIGENHFRGFGLRVDRDKTDDREHLTLDIGSADLEHALDYAKSLGEMSDQHEIVMNYSKIYGARDAGAPEPKYPSVFDMKINGTAGKPYTLGNKVALVSAVAMKNATVNGLRKSEIYLHHSRDPEIAAFTKDFPQIVRMLGEVLTGR